MTATGVRLSSDRRECVRWAVLALGVHAGLVAVLLARTGDPAWFIHLGSQRIPITLARHVLGAHVSVPHLDGHDGRFFWIQGRDPLLLHPHIAVANLDRPAYRLQRIGYPALAAPWRIFGEYGLVWGLIVTNLVAVAAGTYATARLALAVGAPARVALAFALNPAVLIATVFDVSDGLMLAALIGCVLMVRRERWAWAVGLGVLAALAKEPALAALAGIAVFAPGINLRRRVQLVVIPGAIAAAWGIYVRIRLGWPTTAVNEFTAPFYGYLDAYRRGWSLTGDWGNAAIAGALVVLAVVVVVRWWQRRTLLLAAALPFAAMVPFFTAQVLDLADNSLRVVAPIVTLLVLDVYASAGRKPAEAL